MMNCHVPTTQPVEVERHAKNVLHALNKGIPLAPREAAAVLYMHPDGQRFLAGWNDFRRRHEPRLQLPRGGREQNECFRTTAIREFQEETGLVISRKQFRGSGFRYTYATPIPKGAHKIRLQDVVVFQVFAETGALPDPRNIRDEELIGFDWFTAGQFMPRSSFFEWELMEKTFQHFGLI